MLKVTTQMFLFFNETKQSAIIIPKDIVKERFPQMDEVK